MSLILKFPHVFGPRWTEWLGAAASTLGGIGLLHPYEAFQENPIFASMQWIPEELVGGIFLFVGIVRLIGLIVNGRRKKVTPWLRMGSAFVCFMLWLGFSFELMLTGAFSTWLGAYPVLALGEFVNLYRSSHDARIGYDGPNKY